MINGLRLTGFFWTVVVLAGCGVWGESPTSMDSRTYHGAFNNIVLEVDDMVSDVNSQHYDGRLSPVPDQLGSAVAAFMRNEDVKGTPLESEAQKLLDQEKEIIDLWKSRGSVEKIRAVAKEMQDQVDHMKTML